jgi:hypothetical protein
MRPIYTFLLILLSYNVLVGVPQEELCANLKLPIDTHGVDQDSIAAKDFLEVKFKTKRNKRCNTYGCGNSTTVYKMDFTVLRIRFYHANRIVWEKTISIRSNELESFNKKIMNSVVVVDSLNKKYSVDTQIRYMGTSRLVPEVLDIRFENIF